MTVGFREFAKENPGGQWYVDVDSGPVVAGFGVAAGTFGLGAARANGRFDHAYPLSAEVIAISWPLPDGSLLGANLLSNATHAPFIAEAAVLFNLTRTPSDTAQIHNHGALPGCVFVILSLYLGLGLLLTLITIRNLRRLRGSNSINPPPLPKTQIAIWHILVLSAIALLVIDHLLPAVALLTVAQFLPRGDKTATVPTRKNNQLTSNLAK